MSKELLPPLNKEKAKRLIKFLRHVQYLICDDSHSVEERKKMNLLVFRLLDLIDGTYEELTPMKLELDGIDISGCMHEYFLAFCDDGFP